MEKTWSDLHYDIVSVISDRLGLIDLLSFRAVCNYWRSSSVNASAEIESSVAKPWFLLQGETGQCSILTNDNRIYRIEIPEMVQATCLASLVGWLLMYRKNDSSLLFFCPFSKARIEIPQCPLISEQLESESDLFAAFSSCPTDPDCTVVVVVKLKNDEKLKLYMLRRGEAEWTFHEHTVPVKFLDRIKSVGIHERAFYISDDTRLIVAFEYDTMTWLNYVFCTPGSRAVKKTLNYWIDKNGKNKKCLISKCDEMKQLLGIEEYACSLLICGTMVLKGGANDHVIPHECLEENDDNDEISNNNKPRRELKGVWLQPRFHQISEDQRW